jgi:hypothetical protein
MRGPLVRSGKNCLLALEAVAAGLAYGAGLCWLSVCILGSFRPAGLSAPYWSVVPRLRSDTCGIVAFLVVAICIGTSEFLRLRRRGDAVASGPRSPRQIITLSALASAEAVAVSATGLVIYVSVNAVTHPATLDMRATHFAAWPTEGTLRVIALLLCVYSIATLRYLFTEPARRERGHPPSPSLIQEIGDDAGQQARDRRETQDPHGSLMRRFPGPPPCCFDRGVRAGKGSHMSALVLVSVGTAVLICPEALALSAVRKETTLGSAIGRGRC